MDKIVKHLLRISRKKNKSVTEQDVKLTLAINSKLLLKRYERRNGNRNILDSTNGS